MNFQIIPFAEASNIVTLMGSINRVIINPIITLLFAIAVAYFLYGLAQYLMFSDNEELKKTSKSKMIWGIFGMFIMVSVFGILRLITNTIGEDKIDLKTGEYKGKIIDK